MDLQNWYQAADRRIAQVDFDALWPGFHRYDFALYDDTRVVLCGETFPKTDAFLGNTSIFYDGKPIAIWYLPEEMDLDVLASKLIHEMFHAYQNACGESRFPNELKALWECSNLTDNSYLQIKWEENRLLVGLDQQFDASDWQKYLRLRGVRRGRFAQSYFYDSAVEVIEGSAQYVEWEALYQLNAGKAVSAKEQAAQRMQTVTSLLPARPLCYDSGAMLLSICCNNHLPVNRAVGKCSEYLLSEATLDAAAVHPDVQIGYAAAVEQFSRENRMMLEERLRSAKANPPIAEMSEGLELLGVNVYSAQNFNGYLYTEQFVMYRGTDGVPVVKQGDFFLEMLDETRIRRIYRA